MESHGRPYRADELALAGRYVAPWVRALPLIEQPAFRAYRQFNSPELRPLAGAMTRPLPHATRFFPSDSMPDKVARAIGACRALSVKEVTESFEFFQRVRHRLNGRVVADLCCGHGLVGMLFGLMEREVEEVLLVDLKFPDSSQKLEEALCAVGPWLRGKVRRLTRSVKGIGPHLPPGAGVVAVHACGARTDWSIEAAIAAAGPLAVMPCCYAQQTYRGPVALRQHLGAGISIDIQRTYDLEALGYQVSWQEVPPEVTPMNRILSASPPHAPQRTTGAPT